MINHHGGRTTCAEVVLRVTETRGIVQVVSPRIRQGPTVQFVDPQMCQGISDDPVEEVAIDPPVLGEGSFFETSDVEEDDLPSIEPPTKEIPEPLSEEEVVLDDTEARQCASEYCRERGECIHAQFE